MLQFILEKIPWYIDINIYIYIYKYIKIFISRCSLSFQEALKKYNQTNLTAYSDFLFYTKTLFFRL